MKYAHYCMFICRSADYLGLMTPILPHGIPLSMMVLDDATTTRKRGKGEA